MIDIDNILGNKKSKRPSKDPLRDLFGIKPSARAKPKNNIVKSDFMSMFLGQGNPRPDRKTPKQKAFHKKTRTGSGNSHKRFWDLDGDGVIAGLDCAPRNSKKHMAWEKRDDGVYEDPDRELSGDYQKEFIRKNLAQLKARGITSEEKIKSYIRDARLNNPNFNKSRAYTAEESEEILSDNIRPSTAHFWFREEDPRYKGRLVDETLSSPESRNAALSLAYKKYVAQNDEENKNLTFEEFKETPIKVYRGGGGLKTDEDSTSFTLDRSVAEKFGEVKEFKIKPKDSIGMHRNIVESEIIVPKERYDQVKQVK